MTDAEPLRVQAARRLYAVRAAICVLAAAALGWAWLFAVVHVKPAAFVLPQEPAHQPDAGAQPLFAVRDVSDSSTAEVHAASAYAKQDGGLGAFWYGGSREGRPDVSIYFARFADGWWGPPRVVVDREKTAAELGRPLRKLGNASVHRHGDGRLWLFFVSVSVGGWAGSALNLVESSDDGATWSTARRLVSSPFMNVSTLVRGSAIAYADGTIGLPVYHEFAGKFGELLRLGPDARILSKTRLSRGRDALQPEIVAVAADRAVALLRNAGAPHRVLITTTRDAGRTWTAPAATGMPNPDAAIDALAIGDGQLLAVLNDSETSRDRLILATTTASGERWQKVAVLEDRSRVDSAGPHEYSYPWLLRDPAGTYHVFYTWNRKRIRHVAFDRRWLDRAALAASASAAAAVGGAASASLR